MKLSVVIVNYNVKHFLEQCLCSLEQAAAGVDHEVIVVDNASTDGSTEYITSRFPDIKWMACRENNGFSKGNNIAIAQAKGEFILLLNPDTIVTKEAIKGCVEFMETHADAGACGVYMQRTDGTFAPESRRALPTPFVAFCKMSGLSSLFPKSRKFGRYYMQYLNKEEINPIEIISGAYMMLRRSTIEKTGTLDESFFMYGEDIDLSYRILKEGYSNYYLPHRILHYKGESTNKSTYRYVHTFYRAMQLFFKKHYSHYSLLVSLPINIAIWTRAMLAYVGNQFIHRKAVQESPDINCIVFGSSSTIAQVKEILPGNGKHTFVEATEETMPLGHTSNNIDLEGYNTVVYDTEAYRYSTILRLLNTETGHRLRLGTYSSRTKKLITEEQVFDYDNTKAKR
jgi:GT2 family glycosyltransferase